MEFNSSVKYPTGYEGKFPSHPEAKIYQTETDSAKTPLGYSQSKQLTQKQSTNKSSVSLPADTSDETGTTILTDGGQLAVKVWLFVDNEKGDPIGTISVGSEKEVNFPCSTVLKFESTDPNEVYDLVRISCGGSSSPCV